MRPAASGALMSAPRSNSSCTIAVFRRKIAWCSGASAVPHVVHRLDIETSGLLLFGKRAAVVPGVCQQFR